MTNIRITRLEIQRLNEIIENNPNVSIVDIAYDNSSGIGAAITVTFASYENSSSQTVTKDITDFKSW